MKERKAATKMTGLKATLFAPGFMGGLIVIVTLICAIALRILNKKYDRKKEKFVADYQEYLQLNKKLKVIADERFGYFQKQEKIKAKILSLKEEAECFPQNPPRDTNYKAILKEIEGQRYLYLVAQGEIDSLRQLYNEIVASQGKDLLTPPGWQFIKPMK